MRFEVPQFIEIEDKIFGPLTWRQFLYIGGGLGMGAVLFFTANLIVFILIGLPLSLLAGALAFYPVNNRPFSFFLEAMINYISKTKLYLWKRKEVGIYKDAFTPNVIKAEPKKEEGPVATQPISMARRLELEALQKN